MLLCAGHPVCLITWLQKQVVISNNLVLQGKIGPQQQGT